MQGEAPIIPIPSAPIPAQEQTITWRIIKGVLTKFINGVAQAQAEEEDSGTKRLKDDDGNPVPQPHLPQLPASFHNLLTN